MKLQHTNRALSSVVGLAMAAVLTITGLATTSPYAQAADKPAPVSHTIDYVIASLDANTSYMTTDQLRTITTAVSDNWKRLSRGLIKDISIGQVFTLPNFPSESQFCDMRLNSIPSIIATTLGHSLDRYMGKPNGPTLVIMVPEEARLCTFSGLAVAAGNDLSSGGIILLSQPAHAVPVMVHELGHVFGLAHASAVPQGCLDQYWDGPFLYTRDFPAAGGCGMGNWYDQYGDGYNIMGSGTNVDKLDLNGAQKYQLGIIQPGAGMTEVTATADDQILTIHDVHATDPDVPQSIRMTADDPDGADPCAAPVYNIDYDSAAGGVRVFRVAAAQDCSTRELAGSATYPSTIAWTTPIAGSIQTAPSVRSYLLAGESRLTQSGNVRVKVLSADPASGTARVSIQRTDVPGVTSLQVTSTRLGPSTPVVALEHQLTGIVTTNQASWSATSDQSWVRVTESGTTGQTLTVSIQGNATTSERTAVVTVSAGRETTTMNIVQSAGDPSLANDCEATTSTQCAWTDLNTPLTNTIEVLGDKDWFKITPPVTGTYVFTSTRPAVNPLRLIRGQMFDSDGVWTASVSGSDSTVLNMTVYLMAGQTYYLEISGLSSTGNYQISVTTTETLVSVSPRHLYPGGGFDTLTFEIDTTGDWSLVPPTWISATPTSGHGHAVVTLMVQTNLTGKPRTEWVGVWVGGQQVSVTITQAADADDCGETIRSYCSWTDLSQPVHGTIDFTGDNDWYKFTVPTSGTWAVTSSREGTDLLPNPGASVLAADGNRQVGGQSGMSLRPLKFEVFLTAGQSYYLAVTDSDTVNTGNYTMRIARSDADSIDASWPDTNWPGQGGTATVQLGASGAWTADGPDWVTISPSSGSGSSTVTLTAAPNTTGKMRTAWVDFYCGPGWASVPVSQGFTAGPVDNLSVSPTTVTAPVNGDTQTVQVTASGYWEVSGPSWVTASPASGTGNGSVRLTTTANTSGQVRNSTVTVTSGAESATVTVTQPGISDDCGNTVSASCAWASLGTAVAGTLESAGDKDWFKFVAPVAGTYTFAASQAASDPVRNTAGTLYGSDGVTVVGSDSSSAESYQFRITATLAAGQTYYLQVSGVGTGNYTVSATVPNSTTLSLSTTAFNPEAGGGSLAVDVTSNADWRATGPNWISVSPASGSGNGSVTVSVTGNTSGSSRMGQVVFTAGSVTATLWVNQPAASDTTTLSVSPTALSVTDGGGMLWVSVTSNTAWTATASDWITLYGAAGSGNGTLFIAITVNNTGSTRSGSIVVTAGSKTVEIPVTQPAQNQSSLSLSTTAFNPDAGGGSQTVVVTSNTTWRATGPDWITVNPSTGNGNGSVTVSVPANTSGSARTGLVTFTAGTQTVTLSVNQPAQQSTVILSVPRTAGTLGGAGQTVTMLLTCNTIWQVTAPSWLIVTPGSGTGNSNVLITAAPNTTGQARSGYVTFSAGGKVATIYITQPSVR